MSIGETPSQVLKNRKINHDPSQHSVSKGHIKNKIIPVFPDILATFPPSPPPNQLEELSDKPKLIIQVAIHTKSIN